MDGSGFVVGTSVEAVGSAGGSVVSTGGGGEYASAVVITPVSWVMEAGEAQAVERFPNKKTQTHTNLTDFFIFHKYIEIIGARSVYKNYRPGITVRLQLAKNIALIIRGAFERVYAAEMIIILSGRAIPEDSPCYNRHDCRSANGPR
jgi:hypothetical protein